MAADDRVQWVLSGQRFKATDARLTRGEIQGHFDLPGDQLGLILGGVASEDQVGSLPSGDVPEVSGRVPRRRHRPQAGEELVPVPHAYDSVVRPKLLHVELGYVPRANRLPERPLEVLVRHENLGLGEERVIADVVPVAVRQYHAGYVIAPQPQPTEALEKGLPLRVGTRVD